MLSKRVVIFKNDATGDLIHSLPAIYNIINDNDVSEVIIYLSTISKKFQFLVDQPKVKIKLLNYNLNIYEFKSIQFYVKIKLTNYWIQFHMENESSSDSLTMQIMKRFEEL